MDPGHLEGSSSGWRRLLRPWMAATLFIAWYLWQMPAQWQSDSKGVYFGSQHIVDWLQGRSNAIGETGPFPLFQYISGTIAYWAVRHGIGVNIFTFWCACSLLSVAGIIGWFHYRARQLGRPAVGWAVMVIMLSGPLLMYAHSTFNEAVAGLLILWFADAVMGMARPVSCIVLFWLSGITKETAAPLLAVIWIGAMFIQRARLTRGRVVWHVVALLFAFVVTVATNAGWNVPRYGTVWNRQYLQPESLVHFWSWRMHFCVALWAATNGGVAVFWPAVVIVMIGVIATALWRGQSVLPVVTLALFLGGLTVGLSGWFDPFGWWAWGPRLMLSWLPASLMILIRGYPDAFGKFVERCVCGRGAFAIAVVVVCLSAIPNALAAWDPNLFHFFTIQWHFPHDGGRNAMEEGYGNSMYLFWQTTQPLILQPMADGITASAAYMTVGFLAALIV